VREADGKGRHTTARRQLVMVPGGGLVLDTPGMREIHLWDGDQGLDEAFEDIAALAAACRFSDCLRVSEPGCAVIAAVAAGTCPEERLDSYRKLAAELRHLEQLRDERSRAGSRARDRVASKALKDFYKRNR
jgi:ribosome biogenesis GTPase